MSFGFSVGDFISAISLIKDVISSLRTASVSEYRELIIELHGLQRALDEIEHLPRSPEQEPAVNSIKVAALMCQYPLDEFAGKLKKFESLDFGQTQGRAKLWNKKLKWGFTMEEEVRNLRAYLVAHVGSLNMRLLTQGLINTSVATARANQFQASVTQGLESSHTAIDSVHTFVRSSAEVTRNNTVILQKLANIVTSDIIPQLKNLVDIATKVWSLNTQIMSFLVKNHTSPSPNLQHTWFQEPIRFEDALGRIIPIPSEYNWGKLEAIIRDQFSNGPGSTKVLSAEYELFHTNNSSELISRSNFESLTPGMSITMAIIIGQYGEGSLERCPRPGCPAKESTSLQAGGKLCPLCKLRFEASRRPMPCPLRTATTQFSQPEIKYPTSSSLKCKRQSTVEEDIDTSREHKRIRTERQKLKNVRIYQMPLPASPPVINVRKRNNTRKRNIFRQKKLRTILPYLSLKDRSSPTSQSKISTFSSADSYEATHNGNSPTHPNPGDIARTFLNFCQHSASNALQDSAQPHLGDCIAHDSCTEQIGLSHLSQYQYFPNGVPAGVRSSVRFSSVPVFSDPGRLPRVYDPDFGLSTQSLPASFGKIYEFLLEEKLPKGWEKVGFPFPSVVGGTIKWQQLARP